MIQQGVGVEDGELFSLLANCGNIHRGSTLTCTMVQNKLIMLLKAMSCRRRAGNIFRAST